MKEIHEAAIGLPFHTKIHNFSNSIFNNIVCPRIWKAKYIVAAAYRLVSSRCQVGPESTRPVRWAAKLPNYRARLVARQP